ncbi:MAG: chorismate mutase [Firmicutes bacterium]|nr:chorismate mutase [Bacillota bacterium]
MDIKDLRNRIEPIDTELRKLFLERMEIAEQIGKFKAENGLPINNKERERNILSRVTENSGDMELYVYQFFNNLFQISKARQREVTTAPSALRTTIDNALANGGDYFPKTGTIAIQGIEGSNSQSAAEKLFPRGSLTFVKTFEAVFDAVDSGLCKYGILPIENSSYGSVRAVYELLKNKKYYIVGSTKLHIRHELLAKPGATLADIKTIYSHEQAIGQCSAFLASLGENVSVIPCSNTAVAAKKAAESNDLSVAAISSHSCTDIYGLTALNSNICNSDNNYTRFICIAKEPQIFAGANRISTIISCCNTPGALYEILSCLSVLGINMSKLESCPVSGSDFEFIFLLDFEASVKESGVIALLEELERVCEHMTFLGNYSEM